MASAAENFANLASKSYVYRVCPICTFTETDQSKKHGFNIVMTGNCVQFNQKCHGCNQQASYGVLLVPGNKNIKGDYKEYNDVIGKQKCYEKTIDGKQCYIILPVAQKWDNKAGVKPLNTLPGAQYDEKERLAPEDIATYYNDARAFGQTKLLPAFGGKPQIDITSALSSAVSSSSASSQQNGVDLIYFLKNSGSMDSAAVLDEYEKINMGLMMLATAEIINANVGGKKTHICDLETKIISSYDIKSTFALKSYSFYFDLTQKISNNPVLNYKTRYGFYIYENLQSTTNEYWICTDCKCVCVSQQKTSKCIKCSVEMKQLININSINMLVSALNYCDLIDGSKKYAAGGVSCLRGLYSFIFSSSCFPVANIAVNMHNIKSYFLMNKNTKKMYQNIFFGQILKPKNQKFDIGLLDGNGFFPIETLKEVFHIYELNMLDVIISIYMTYARSKGKINDGMVKIDVTFLRDWSDDNTIDTACIDAEFIGKSIKSGLCEKCKSYMIGTSNGNTIKCGCGDELKLNDIKESDNLKKILLHGLSLYFSSLIICPSMSGGTDPVISLATVQVAKTYAGTSSMIYKINGESKYLQQVSADEIGRYRFYKNAIMSNCKLINWDEIQTYLINKQTCNNQPSIVDSAIPDLSYKELKYVSNVPFFKKIIKENAKKKTQQ